MHKKIPPFITASSSHLHWLLLLWRSQDWWCPIRPYPWIGILDSYCRNRLKSYWIENNHTRTHLPVTFCIFLECFHHSFLWHFDKFAISLVMMLKLDSKRPEVAEVDPLLSLAAIKWKARECDEKNLICLNKTFIFMHWKISLRDYTGKTLYIR